MSWAEDAARCAGPDWKWKETKPMSIDEFLEQLEARKDLTWQFPFSTKGPTERVPQPTIRCLRGRCPIDAIAGKAGAWRDDDVLGLSAQDKRDIIHVADGFPAVELWPLRARLVKAIGLKDYEKVVEVNIEDSTT